MSIPDPAKAAARLPDDPPRFELEAGRQLLRIYDPRRGGWDAQRFFGPLDDMRFDHHPPPCGLHRSHSVWYAATSLRGAVAEVFGRSGRIDRAAGQRMAVATVVEPFEVLDLVGVSARAFGMTQEIGASTDYARTCAWARALYDRYGDVVGLRWRARQAGSIGIVLDDRLSMRRLTAQDWALTDLAVWPRIARAARDCHIGIL